MYDCEVCGKSVSTVYVVEIEGAQMNACEKCARGKSAIEVMGPEKEANKKHARPAAASKEEDEVIAGYGSVIRKARESFSMPLKVLAERISEKESTLFRVENMKMLPSAALVKKLERELGIKLTEKQVHEARKQGSGRNEPITLGDAFIIKDNRK